MKHIMRWGLALCLLLAVTAYAAPPASAAALSAPCTGDHTGWVEISSLEDLASKVTVASNTYTLAANTSYVLTGNIVLDRCITMNPGANICLNGHTLSASGSGFSGITSLFRNWGTNAAPNNICDCVGTGVIRSDVTNDQVSNGINVINVGNSGTTNLWGGSISGGTGRYGIVYINSDTTFNMYGGAIVDTKCLTVIGGVYTADGGTFNYYGGTISGNKNSSDAIYNVRGTVNYPVSINGAQLTATSPTDPTTVSGTNCSYHVPTGVLTLTGDPTSVAFQSMALDPVVKLGADVTTGAFNTVSSGTSLTVDLNGHTLTGTASEMSVNGTFTLTDSTGDNGVLDSRVALNSSGTFYLESGKITTTRSANWKGGGVHSTGTFVMNGGKITGCATTGNAGGVRVDGGSFTMNGGSIEDNTVGSGNVVGGAVYYTNGTFTMNGGTIKGTAAYGGGVCVNGSSLTFTMTGGEITGCNAAGDSAKRGGAGVYLTGSGVRLVMTGGTIHDNTSESTGGGVTLASGASLTMSGTAAIQDNSAGTMGGGVYAPSGTTFTMNGGTISGNSSTAAAGGVYCAGTMTMASGAEISGNSGTIGGGVRLDGAGTFTMNGGLIADNSASECGGGVGVNGSSAVFTMNGGEIGASEKPNTTPKYGAGVVLMDGSFTMANGTIGYNSVTATDIRGTAGVYVASGKTFTMTGGSIEHNSSYNGGAVLTEGGTFQLQGGTISDNTASSYGGAVCMRAGGTFTMTGGTITGNSGNYGAVMIWTGAPMVNVSGGSITANRSSASWAGGITQMKGTLTVSGTAVIRDNYRVSESTKTDITVMGDTASMTLSGGTVGSLGFAGAGAGTTITGSVTGGTIETILEAYSTGTVTVNVSGGQIALLGSSSYIHVSGGSFGSTEHLLDYATEPGMTVVPSGVDGYPYALGLAVAPLANMRLDEALTFYAYVSDDAAVWTVNGSLRTPASVAVTVGGNAVTADMTQEGGYYKVAVPIFAKQMSDTVSVSFQDAGGNEIRTVTDSVKAYATRILADPTDAGEATLMTDMLNYGEAAQIYFNYNTAALATDGVSLGTPSSVTLAVDPTATVHTAAFHSSNLTLEERIDFSMYFWSSRVSDGAAYTYVVTDGVGGSTVTSGSGTFAALGTTELVEAKIDGLDLSAMEGAVISITYTDEKDTASITAKDSLANYLARNEGLDIDDAPSTYAEDGTLISAASGYDASDLYAKVMAFAHAANAYSYGTQA